MRTKKAYIKALLLLTVFSMNTVVGTACSLSVAFHSAHHHAGSSSGSHEHGDAIKHSHEHSGDHHSNEKKGSAECCSKLSVAFDKLDKSIAQGLEIQTIDLPGYVLTSLHNTILLLSRNEDRSIIGHFRWRLPATIQDLRIVMQSFQI